MGSERLECALPVPIALLAMIGFLAICVTLVALALTMEDWSEWIAVRVRGWF